MDIVFVQAFGSNNFIPAYKVELKPEYYFLNRPTTFSCDDVNINTDLFKELLFPKND